MKWKQVPRSWITSTRMQAEISKLAWPRRSHPARSTRVYNVLAYFYADYFDAGTPALERVKSNCFVCGWVDLPSVSEMLSSCCIQHVPRQRGSPSARHRLPSWSVAQFSDQATALAVWMDMASVQHVFEAGLGSPNCQVHDLDIRFVLGSCGGCRVLFERLIVSGCEEFCWSGSGQGWSCIVSGWKSKGL